MKLFSKWTYYFGSVFTLLKGVKNWKTLFEIFLGPEFDGIKWLELRRDGIKVAVRGKMDAWSVKETLLDRFYACYGTEIQPGWTVVDIGAAIGEFTIDAALATVDGMVLAYEPNPGSLNILRQNLRTNQISNVEVYSYGVWDCHDEIALEMTNNEPLQAQSVTNGDVIDPNVPQTSIPVIPLAEVISKCLGGRVDLLKLDTEGAEFEILMADGGRTLQLVDRIIMEYHDVAPGKTHIELRDFLAAQGFNVSLYANRVHDNIGYLYAAQARLEEKML